MNQDAISRIERYVAAGCPVRTESLLADAHVFWWDTRDGEEADFAIINRDGNTARAFQEDGIWHIAKNLGRAGAAPWHPEDWQLLDISSPDLRVCAQKLWLPSRGEERLCFLPKELTPPKSRRLLICRDQLFKLIGNQGTGFRLEQGGVQSPIFEGKPWESTQAVEWAVNHCRSPDAPQSAEAILMQTRVAQATVAMEDLPGFGMF